MEIKSVAVKKNHRSDDDWCQEKHSDYFDILDALGKYQNAGMNLIDKIDYFLDNETYNGDDQRKWLSELKEQILAIVD